MSNNIITEEKDTIYISHLVKKFTDIPEENILVISRHMVVNEDTLPLYLNHLKSSFDNNSEISIFFNHHSEGFNPRFLIDANLIVDSANKLLGIPIDRFNLVTGAVHSQRNINVYKKVCEEYGHHQINLWFNNFWETCPLNRGLPAFNYTIDKKKKKLLCFNGMPRMHRLAAVCELMKRDLIDKTYLSLNLNPEDISNVDTNEISKVVGAEFPQYYKKILTRNRDKFPFKLTLAKDIKNAYDINQEDILLFRTSLVSLVNETIFSSADPYKNNFLDSLSHPCTLASEKLWKCFQGTHPFIVLSTPHFLRDLRSLGYKTFGPFIDESYDDEFDDAKRFKKVMDEVERICNFTDEEELRFQKNVRLALSHNYNLLCTRSISMVKAI